LIISSQNICIGSKFYKIDALLLLFFGIVFWALPLGWHYAPIASRSSSATWSKAGSIIMLLEFLQNK